MLVREANTQVIEAILFDMNSALRACEPHLPTQSASRARILELMGKKAVDPAFWEEKVKVLKEHLQFTKKCCNIFKCKFGFTICFFVDFFCQQKEEGKQWTKPPTHLQALHK